MLPPHPLGGHDLERVAGGDVLAGPLDRRHVALAGGLDVHLAGRQRRHRRRRRRPRQRRLQLLDAGRLADQRHRAADVVEGDHRVGQHEPHLRQPGVVGVGRGSGTGSSLATQS